MSINDEQRYVDMVRINGQVTSESMILNGPLVIDVFIRKGELWVLAISTEARMFNC